MSPSTNFDVESDVLAVRYLDGSASPEEVERLDALLVADPARREWFATLCIVVTGLGEVPAAPSLPQGDAESQEINIPPPINTPSLFGDAYHGTIGFFSQEVPLAWLITTAIMGVMLFGAWAYKITHHQHIAEAPSQSVPSRDRPEMVFVGRITGMVDVKWSDDPRYLPPLDFAHVPLGRKYILDAGLLEITYDSGAKVILEGPCTYEVESTAGGYLSLGKLTARVGEDKETKRQGDKEKKADAASPHLLVSRSPGLPVSPLFSVRTPTALITDLGTEFGVEVDELGVSKTHVFQGKVEVRLTSDGEEARAIQLGENESARVERADGAGQMSIIRYAAGKAPSGFVRAMPRPKPAETVRIVETFDGAELGAAFNQMPPGRYVNDRGADVYQQPSTDDFKESRGYIRTVATDFCDRDFVFEATFQVHLDGPAHVPGSNAPHHIFFGLGDGVPNANFYDVVTCGLVLNFVVDNGQVLVRRYDPDSDSKRVVFSNTGGTVTEVAPLGSLSPGRHRFRMTKTGRCVKFAVDADFKGEFQQDFISRPIDLPTAVPLLDATNSRLLVGAGYCDVMTVRFEELSVTYLKTP